MAELLLAPISLSRYDHEHDTSQKTVTMFMDFWPCPAKAEFRPIKLYPYIALFSDKNQPS
jgi:hypothetical protein